MLERLVTRELKHFISAFLAPFMATVILIVYFLIDSIADMKVEKLSLAAFFLNLFSWHTLWLLIFISCCNAIIFFIFIFPIWRFLRLVLLLDYATLVLAGVIGGNIGLNFFVNAFDFSIHREVFHSSLLLLGSLMGIGMSLTFGQIEEIPWRLNEADNR